MCAKGWILCDIWVQKGGSSVCVPCAKLDPQRCHADHCPLEQSIKLRVTSSMCRCPNRPISISDVAVMGCQSSCNRVYSTCNFMGRQLAFLKYKQSVYFVIREGSSRNTVQFLTEIDRNHKCQLRNVCKILFLEIGVIIDVTEKKLHVFIIHTV